MRWGKFVFLVPLDLSAKTVSHGRLLVKKVPNKFETKEFGFFEKCIILLQLVVLMIEVITILH